MSQEMLLPAFCTTNSGETSLNPPAGQEIFDRANNHRAQRSRARLEALFVSPDIAAKVSLKQLIEGRMFRMSRTVLRRRFRNNPALGILIYAKAFFGCLQTRDDRPKLEGHGGQQAATDLIAEETFEPKHLRAGTVATEFNSIPTILTPHAKLDKLSPA
jgi:hypothetical protein